MGKHDDDDFDDDYLIFGGEDHPLLNAVVCNELDSAKQMLAEGVEAEVLDEAARDAAAFDRAEMLALLLDAGVNPETMVDEDAGTLLSVAAHGAASRTVELLLARGAKVDGVGDALPPLCRADGLPVVKLLVAHGAKVNAIDSRNQITPLMCASGNGDSASVEFLLERGAAVDTENFMGMTATAYALIERHLPVLKILLAHGADLEHADKMGETLLFYAAKMADAQLSQFLLNAGADPDRKNNAGKTPVQCAPAPFRKKFRELIAKRK